MSLTQGSASFSQMLKEEELFHEEELANAGSGSLSHDVAPEPETFEEDAVLQDPRVIQQGAHATLDDLYQDLEDVEFSEARVNELLGEHATAAIENLQGALQLPFPTVLLSLVSLQAFSLHIRQCWVFRLCLGWSIWGGPAIRSRSLFG